MKGAQVASATQEVSMAGVPGRGGPVPKRSEDRVRRNKVDTTTVVMVGDVEIPEPDASWHPVASQWYLSLAKSGQSKYFEPSDWSAAYLLAGQITRMLAMRRASATMLAAVWSAMGDLLTTEAERRRVRVEVKRQKSAPENSELASVTSLDSYRSL